MKHWHRHRGTLQVVFDEPPLTIINRHHMVDRLTIATISCQIMDRLLEMGECLDRTMRDATGRLFLGRSWTLAVAGGNGPYLQIRCICMLVIVFSVYWFNYLEHLLCFFVSLLFLSLSIYIYIYILHRNKSRSCTLSQQPEVHTICFRSHGGQFAAGKETWQGGKKTSDGKSSMT